MQGIFIFLSSKAINESFTGSQSNKSVQKESGITKSGL